MADIVKVVIDAAGGPKTLSPDEFKKMSPVERVDLILASKIKFFDAGGNAVKASEAIRSLSS